MFSNIFNFSKSYTTNDHTGVIAGLSAVAGLAVGVGLTAAIADLIVKSKEDTARKKRNIIAEEDLKGDNYELIQTYEDRILPLIKVIREHYPDQDNNTSHKAEEFLKAIQMYALPTLDEAETKKAGKNMMHVPDLGAGLSMKVKEKKGSGVDIEIVRLLEKYKLAKDVKSDGIDKYVTMMQVLINIVIIYKQFITHEKILPEEIIESSSEFGKQDEVQTSRSRLEIANEAINKFIESLKITEMFKDRGFKLIQFTDTKRQMNLPKIQDMVDDMGKEAVNFQRNLTAIEKSIEKQQMIIRIQEAFSEFIERTAVFELSQSDTYSPYLRAHGIIDFDVYSKTDKLNNDDLIKKTITKHLQNSHTTFYSDKIQNRSNSEFSHLNFLINKTDGNSYEKLTGKATLPQIASVTTELFPVALSSDSVCELTPAIDQYLKYLNIAAAMQADLTARLSAHGWVGLSLSGELQYRQKLIDAFMDRAEQINRDTILKNGSYFNEFLKRTTNTDFIDEAMDRDSSVFYKLSARRIIEADRDKYAHDVTQVTLSETSEISLDQTLHATAFKNASSLKRDASKIDAEFLKYQQKALKIAQNLNIQEVSSVAMNKEFLYNIALACQEDKDLQKNILAIESNRTNDKNVLDGYITELASIKSEFKEVFQACENITSLGTNYHVQSTRLPVKLDDTTYHLDQHTYNGFILFVQERLEVKDSMLIVNGYKSLEKEIKFQNKESVVELRNHLKQFAMEFRKQYKNALINEKEKSGFFNGFLGKFNHLIEEIDSFNNEVVTPAEIGKLQIERQKVEFLQMINQMQVKYQEKTETLVDRLEAVETEHKQAINTLFKDNNEVLQNMIATIKSAAELYSNTVNAESGEDNINSCFEKIKSTISGLEKKQESIYSVLNEALDHNNKSNEHSEKVHHTNEDIIKQNAILVETLKTTIPGIISDIMQSVKEHNDSMLSSLNNRNTTLQNEKTELLEKIAEAEKVNASITENMNALEEDNQKSIKQLQEVESDLATQKTIIASVDEKLSTLNDTINKIILQIKNDDLSNTTNSIISDIQKLKSSSKSIEFTQEYGEIIDRMTVNHTKSEAFIEAASRLLGEAVVQINDLISTNQGVTQHNNNAANNAKSAMATLASESERIKELKYDINLYRKLFESARDKYMNSLEEQKQKNDEHSKQIIQLTNKLTDISENQVKKLENEVNALTEKNTNLTRQHHQDELTLLQLQNDYKGLVERSESAKQEYEDQTKVLSQTIDSQKELLQKSLRLTLSTLQESIDQLKTNETVCRDSFNKINEDLNDIRNDMVNTNIAIVNRLSNSQADTLVTLKQSCIDFADFINTSYKERLKNEWRFTAFDPDNKNDTGVQKLEWMNNLHAKLQNPHISDEEFHKTFKALLMIYLQNKDGNEWYNVKRTSIGKQVVTQLNTEKYTNIRQILFGAPDITYEQLSGKLLTMKDGIKNIAKAEIHKTRPRMELTINQFSLTNNRAPLDLMMKKAQAEVELTGFANSLAIKKTERKEVKKQLEELEKTKSKGMIANVDQQPSLPQVSNTHTSIFDAHDVKTNKTKHKRKSKHEPTKHEPVVTPVGTRKGTT